MSDNDLIKFVRENNFYCSPGIKANFLSLAGGAWNIPDSKLNKFYDIIRISCLKNIPISVVEVRTDVFKHFIDLDLQSPLAIDIPTIKKICLTIQKTLIDNTSLNTVNMYVYAAKPRDITKDDKKLIKTGIHIYYPDVLVDCTIALELRKRMIVELQNIDNEIDWVSTVDESVYKGSGLRLPHMPKLKKCKCEKINGVCKFGCTFGVINENAIYLPMFCISGQNIESVDKLKNNMRHSFAITKIRASISEKTPNITVKPRGVLSKDLETLDIALTMTKKFPPAKGTQKSYNNYYISNEMILSPDIQEKVKNFIHRSYHEHPVYSKISINYVKKLVYKSQNKSNVYTKYIVNTTCKFCCNINDYHNSNNIYFLIFISGSSMQMTQRCHCTCPKPHFGTTKLCKTYSSPPIEIKSTMELYKLLMPPVISNNNLNQTYESTIASTLNINVADDEGNKALIFSRLNKVKPASPPHQFKEKENKESEAPTKQELDRKAMANRLKAMRGKI